MKSLPGNGFLMVMVSLGMLMGACVGTTMDNVGTDDDGTDTGSEGDADTDTDTDTDSDADTDSDTDTDSDSDSDSDSDTDTDTSWDTSPDTGSATEPDPHDQCIEVETPGCPDCPCETCVCAMDSYCCDTAWDSLCVEECVTDCGGESCGECPFGCTADADTCYATGGQPVVVLACSDTAQTCCNTTPCWSGTCVPEGTCTTSLISGESCDMPGQECCS